MLTLNCNILPKDIPTCHGPGLLVPEAPSLQLPVEAASWPPCLAVLRGQESTQNRLTGSWDHPNTHCYYSLLLKALPQVASGSEAALLSECRRAAVPAFTLHFNDYRTSSVLCAIKRGSHIV